ncbi:hypothetical protein PHMEG_00035929 [Phytophthora megakarya]|uniref:Eukaryotic/viral aspartic protease n=1 Tax=Phytophthora megakarya TaxID=4795 RepID=A0A225UML1_9STRA|nr:hypothetical protein PHMEG_00035929 [Phytophthora megakarya]
MDGGMIMGKKRIGKSHWPKKLKLKFGKPISVSGLGGVPTNITASAKLKITLGPRVVYVVDVWVSNIGGSLDVLLGMNFMFSAGVRLCVKEGLVQLPDEETEGGYPTSSVAWLTEFVKVYYVSSTWRVPDGSTARVPKVDAAIDHMGWTRRSLGHSGVVRFAWKVPAAIKVINISDRIVIADWRTEVAQVVENGFFPRPGRYVRVGTRRYRE